MDNKDQKPYEKDGNIETHQMDQGDIPKAKKKGSFFGDPIVIIE